MKHFLEELFHIVCQKNLLKICIWLFYELLEEHFKESFVNTDTVPFFVASTKTLS